MSYFKVVRDGNVIDAGEIWLKWQKKNRIMVSCPPEDAQFILSGDGNTIYRVQWLNPAPEEAGQHEVVEAAIIERQEFLDLRAQLDEGETVPEPEPIVPEPDPKPEPDPEQPEAEKPMTVAEMRQKIAQQQEQIVEQQGRIDDLTEALDLLLSGVTEDE